MRRSKKTNEKVLKLNLRLNYTVVYVVMGIRRKSAVVPNGCIVFSERFRQPVDGLP